MSLLYLEDNPRMSGHPVKLGRRRWSTTPKIPSNLVKANNAMPTSSEMLIYDREKLMGFLNERESNLFKTRDEYEEQFENFFTLAKRFHTEKLNNLKLTFKNQILKQQIYFETELLELSKECMRDYECSGGSKSVNSRRMFSSKKQSTKFEREKQLVKVCKTDMKRLLDYMRESLINSSDTLIEAFETCHILKALENNENNFQKRNSQMKLTTSHLVRDSSRPDSNKTDCVEKKAVDSELSELNQQLSDEQELFNNYKQEMDELMHTLDDIELQHLQRKDQLTTKTKFFNKLKTKFKFIETKYDKLNKQISDLKNESGVFKKLWVEKQHNSSADNNLECNLYTKSSVLSSLSTALSESSSSRSSSTSSLSDCVGEITSSNQDTNNSSSSSKSSSSSSSSSLSHQDISELMTGSENLDFEELIDEHNIFDTEPKNECHEDDELPNFSLSDYNRKLCLINELITLHKSRMSPKDLWSMSSESEHAPGSHEHPSFNNFIKTNIKYLNIKNEIEKDMLKYEENVVCYKEIDQLCGPLDKQLVILNNVKQESCLNFSEVSTDGDRICVENANLKSEYDVSHWYVTRQIDEMSVKSYKFPRGSVIASGKCLRVNEPFENDQLDYLQAIKTQQTKKTEYHSSELKKSFLKIRTKLIAPDGTLKAMHIQEIPQFYQEIYKYANLIKFL